MLSTAIAAWRNLVKRLSVDWLILTAGAITILLAMILLAAGPIYADAVTESGLQRSLEAAQPAESTVVAQVRTPSTELQTVDDIARTTLQRTLAGLDVTITRVVEAESLQLPPDVDQERADLVRIRSMEHIENHASLLEGAWPSSSSETVLSQVAAEQAGLEVGEVVVLTNPRQSGDETRFELVGVYRLDDRNDPFWLGDPLLLDGVVEGGGFRTVGPFIVSDEALLDLTPRLTATWRAHPDFDTLEVTEAPAVRIRISSLGAGLNEALASVDGAAAGLSDFTVDTGLDRLLSGTARSLTVTRSSVIALLIQLAILAGYALALTAGLLIDTRRTETSLLSARGASPGQVLAVAGMEAALLATPAALVAPALSAWTLDVLVRFGPLARVGLGVAPEVTTESQVIALIAAAAAMVALSVPAWRSARAASGASRRSTRQRARSGAQRAGVDIALVGLAILAFWQLESLGQVTSTIQGRFGVDPILIAAPTLGLLAGSVLALRIVPMLARAGERAASGGRGPVGALSAWQVARRPMRYARSGLLLIMAVAIGFFAASYSSTWVDSQRDQADFQVGADLRVEPNRRTGDSITDLHLVTAHESIPGVARSMAVRRTPGALPGSDSPGEFLLLDAEAATEVIELRPDLAPDFERLMARLADGRPEPAGVAIPPDTTRIGVLVDVSEEPVMFEDGQEAPLTFHATVSLVLQDDDGLLHRIEAGQVEPNAGVQTLVTEPLDSRVDGAGLSPAHPLRVIAVEFSLRQPFVESEVTLDLIDLVGGTTGGELTTLGFDPTLADWMSEAAMIGTPFGPPPAVAKTLEQPDDALRLDIQTGTGFNSVVVYSIRRAWARASSYPVVASAGWLESTNRSIGGEVLVDNLGTGRVLATISGVVDRFPTTEGDVLIADLPTIELVKYTPGISLGEVDELWLNVTGELASVQEALLGPPYRSVSVHDRERRFLDLSTDPVALGTIGALSIGFLAAAVFAAVGFAVSATVSARERMTEFGLLRALGLSPRELGAWMTLEQGTLVISSLLFGTLVGWSLTRFILPLVSVTQEGSRPTPDVTVVYPWTTVMTLELGLVAVLAVIVTVMTLLLRRLGLGSILRLGEY